MIIDLSRANHLLSFVTETTVCTLHINIPFDEWVNKFDKDEVPTRAEKNIKVLYRGVSNDNPHKAIVIAQAEEGVIDKYIQQNFYTFEKNGADMSTAIPSIWLK